MVSAELSESISETLDILSHMEKSYTDKISKGFKEFLENNKSVNYISKLDHSKKINEMNLKEKTKNILATIYMSYWCTQQEKLNYNDLLKENEKKYQIEQKEKYNPDNMFKRNIPNQSIIEENIESDNSKNLSIVKYKESIFKKIISKIKKFFSYN